MSECLIHNNMIQDLVKENEQLHRQNEALRMEEETLKRDLHSLKCEVTEQNQHLQQKLQDLEVHKHMLQSQYNQRLRNANHKLLQLRTLVEEKDTQLTAANGLIQDYKTIAVKALADCKEGQKALNFLEARLSQVQQLSARPPPPEGTTGNTHSQITKLELRIGDIENKLHLLTLQQMGASTSSVNAESDCHIHSNETSQPHVLQKVPASPHEDVVEEGLIEPAGSLEELTLFLPDAPGRQHGSVRMMSTVKRRPALRDIEESPLTRSSSAGHLDDIKARNNHCVSSQRTRAATTVDEAADGGATSCSVQQIRAQWQQWEEQNAKRRSWKFWKK